MVTKLGVVKKISLKHFSKPRSSGVRAMNLPNDDSDSLVDVKVIPKGKEVLIATSKGQAIRFDADDIRDMGRASYGVTGIKMEKDDYVVSLEVLENKSIMTITENGYGKRSDIEDYRKTARAGKGVINMKVTDKTGEIITSQSVVESDNIIVTTKKGIVIRTPVSNIRIMGRATQGVRIINLKDGDSVIDLIRVPEEDIVEGASGESVVSSVGEEVAPSDEE